MDKNTQQPVAWMLECPTMTGDTGWKLSWNQSGAGVCNRLAGEDHEKALYTAPPVPRDAQQADHIVDAAKMVQAEPVAWLVSVKGEPELGHWFAEEECNHDSHNCVPLYAQPPAVAVPDEWHQFVKDISQQEPEKPDYWNSCGQCARNIDRAEDLIDAAQGNLDLNVPDEVMKDAARWKIIKQLASEDGGHALSILVMYCGLTECDTDALDAAIDKVIAENTAAPKPEGV